MDDKVKEGVAWLSLAARGGLVPADQLAPTSLEALAKWAERRSASDDQRDEKIAIPETIEVVLKNPIEKVAGNGEILRKLTFRTPNWLELKTLRKKAGAGELAVMDGALVLLTADDLTQADFDRLKSLDAQRCVEALSPFLALEGA